MDFKSSYSAAQQAASAFLAAEQRAHKSLHTALAKAYALYRARSSFDAELQQELATNNLAPTNAQPLPNQLIKLLFFPSPDEQLSKRQTISKWAIVLRECEEAHVEPFKAAAHIGKHTIDGLVASYRQRQTADADPNPAKARTAFEQGKVVARSLGSVGEFEPAADMAEGFGLALIEYDGSRVVVRRVVADETNTATQRFTTQLTREFPYDASGLLQFGLLCKSAVKLYDKHAPLQGRLSNSADGLSAWIGEESDGEDALARGWFPSVKNLPLGTYAVDREAILLLGRLFPKARLDEWKFDRRANGVWAQHNFERGKREICLERLDVGDRNDFALRPYENADISVSDADDLLDRLAQFEKTMRLHKPKPKRLGHEIDETRWLLTVEKSENTMKTALDDLVVNAKRSAAISLPSQSIKNFQAICQVIKRTYGGASASLSIAKQHAVLSVNDEICGEWTLMTRTL